MPVYIGDYLADTMHLSTEQHGAYLLLLFHLWWRGVLPDDDAALAQISGLSPDAWSMHRAVLGEFFEVREGLWQHGRVERERTRTKAKARSNASKASMAASSRWSNADAPSIAQALLDDAKPQSQSHLETGLLPFSKPPRSVDSRHSVFRSLLSEYWREKNHAAPEMPWQGRDAKALSDFLAASPSLNDQQFRQMLGNRARSAVAHGDRVYLWIANLTRFQEEMTVYNKPVSAGGVSASRAEINRNAVVNAVDRALALARERAGGVGEAGVEPAGFHGAGMLVADGSGSGRAAAGMPGGGDYELAARNAADGEAGTDGPVPYCAAASGAGGVTSVGRLEGCGGVGVIAVCSGGRERPTAALHISLRCGAPSVVRDDRFKCRTSAVGPKQREVEGSGLNEYEAIFGEVRDVADLRFAIARAVRVLRAAMEKEDNYAVTTAHVRNLAEIEPSALAAAYAEAEKSCTFWPSPGQIRELAGWSDESRARAGLQWVFQYLASHGVEGRANGGAARFGEDETGRRVLLDTGPVIAAPELPEEIAATLAMLGDGTHKGGLRFVSQHPVVQGCAGWSGDFRTAERIEAQWIRCYVHSVRKLHHPPYRRP